MKSKKIVIVGEQEDAVNQPLELQSHGAEPLPSTKRGTKLLLKVHKKAGRVLSRVMSQFEHSLFRFKELRGDR